MAGRAQMKPLSDAGTSKAEAATAGGESSVRAWVMVAAAMVLMAGFQAGLLCFGVFAEALGQEFGWSTAVISGAMSLCVGVSGVMGILMGRVTDKHGISLVLSLGLLTGVASCLLLSSTESEWQLYLWFGVGVGICSGCGYSPVTAAISKLFVEKRALAMGVALAGIVLGQMVFSPVMNAVIEADGWRMAFFVLAMIVLACGVPGTLLLSKRPEAGRDGAAAPHGSAGGEHRGLGLSVKQAVKTAPFWMVTATGFAMGAGYFLLMSSIFPAALDRGLSEGSAALIVTVSAVGGLVGSVLAGWLTARLSGRWALLVLCLGQAVAIFCFIATDSVWSFYAAALVFGVSFGAAAPVRLAMVAPLFGIRAVGALLGLAVFSWSCGGIFSPYLAGYTKDATGSYSMAFLVCGVLLVLGVLSIVLWGRHNGEGEEATREASTHRSR